MQVQTIENANILKPNPDHKNFVETGEVIPKGTLLEGNEKYISGLRRGEAFTYKLFITKDKKIIYFNKIQPMANVEVTLGADGIMNTQNANQSFFAKSDAKDALLILGGAALIGILIGGTKNVNNAPKLILFTLTGIGIGVVANNLIKVEDKVIIQK
jgi:hypothetical protein